jgi:hypothetical protein
MDFSYIDDKEWTTLDDDTKSKVIDLAFQRNVTSDPEWGNVPDEQKLAVYDLYKKEADDYSISKEPEPKDYGLVGDFAQGTLAAVKGVAGGMRMTDLDPTEENNPIAKLGKYLFDLADEAEEKYDILKPRARDEGFLMEGVRSTAQSIPASTLPIAGAVAGGVAGLPLAPFTGGLSVPIGAAIGGMGTLFGTFFGGTYQNTYEETVEELKTKGIEENKIPGLAHKHALTSSSYEFGTELAGDLAAATFFGFFGKTAIKQGLKQTIKSITGPGGTEKFLKAYAKTVPFEMGSEMVAGYGQAKSAQGTGLLTPSPEDAMKQAIIPSILMPLFFGGSIHGVKAYEARGLYNDLNSDDQNKRQIASDKVAARLDPEDRKIWNETATEFIGQGKEILLSKSIVDFASIQTIQKGSAQVEFINNLAEGLKKGEVTPEQVTALKSDRRFLDMQDQLDQVINSSPAPVKNINDATTADEAVNTFDFIINDALGGPKKVQQGILSGLQDKRGEIDAYLEEEGAKAEFDAEFENRRNAQTKESERRKKEDTDADEIEALIQSFKTSTDFNVREQTQREINALFSEGTPFNEGLAELEKNIAEFRKVRSGGALERRQTAMGDQAEQARRDKELIQAKTDIRNGKFVPYEIMDRHPELLPEGETLLTGISVEDRREASVKALERRQANMKGLMSGVLATPIINTEDKKAIDEVNTEPSDGQKDAGNYKKASVKVDGFGFSIENPAGSTRSGTDESGKAWSQKMHSHYGYFKRTLGKDGDQVDAFINPEGKEGKPFFVVDQVDQKTKKFDEHKVMVGYETEEEARKAYLANYEDGWGGIGNITEMGQEEFKSWVKDGTRTKKPAAGQTEDTSQDWKIKDNDLASVDKISNRIALIEKQVEKLELVENPANFDTHHNRIKKLNERKDLLWGKRAGLLKKNRKPEVIKTYTNKEDGVQSIITKGLEDGKYHVVVKDIDSGNILTTGYIFPKLDDAISKANEIFLKGEDKPIGTNQDGQNIYQDKNGVRSYETEPGYLSTQPVSIVPGGQSTFDGASTLYNKGRHEYLTVEELKELNDKKVKPEKAELPKGWTELETGGLATNQDPISGGIVDSEIKSGKWFVIPNNDNIGKLTGFATRAEALEALKEKAKSPSNKELTERQFVAGDKVRYKKGFNKDTKTIKKITNNGMVILESTPTEYHPEEFVKVLTQKDIKIDDHVIAIKDKDIFGKEPLVVKHVTSTGIKVETLDGKSKGGHYSFDNFEKVEKPKKEKSKSEFKKLTKIGKIIDFFTSQLRSGKSFQNIVQARKAYTDETGINVVAGTILSKIIDEAIEVAGVNAARAIVDGGRKYNRSDADIFDKLVKLQSRMPNLSVRTSTSVQEQAYSTPLPLAWLASVLAGVTHTTTLYEPSAGNGALTIGADPKNVTVNELNKERYENLSKMGFHIVSNSDGTVYVSIPKDVVLANPPFGAVKDDNGVSKIFKINDQYSTTQIDHAMVFKALESMKPGGRAVFIVGSVSDKSTNPDTRKILYRAKNKVLFYKTLFDSYNVVDHFTIAGKLYSQQGAAWPVDIIVIDGKGKSKRVLPGAIPPDYLSTIEEVKGKLNETYSMDNTGRERGPSDSDGQVPTRGGTDTGTPPSSTGRPPTRVNQPGGRSGEGSSPTGKQDGGRGSSLRVPEEVADSGVGSPGGESEISGTSNVLGDTGTTPEGTGTQDEQGSGADKGGRGRPGDISLGGKSVEDEFSPDNLLAEWDKQSEEAEPSIPPPPQPISITKIEDAKTYLDYLEFEKLKINEYGSKDAWHLSDEYMGIYPTVKMLYDKAQADVAKALKNKPKTQPLKKKADEVKQHLADAVNEFKNINDLLGDRGSLSTEPLDENVYTKIKEALQRALNSVIKAGQTAKEFVALALKNLGKKARPYFERFVRNDMVVPEKDLPKPKKKTKPEELTDSDTHVVYSPASKSSAIGTLTPLNMAHASEIAFADLFKKYGEVDKFVAKELGYTVEDVIGKDGNYGYFSGEQIDAIALAISNIKKGAGFIIGDQTGVGKGRVVAAMIRYAMKNKLTPIFVTDKPNLYSDMYRDLSDIGMADIADRVLMTNANEKVPLGGDGTKVLKTKSDHNVKLRKMVRAGKLAPEYDVIFTTYDQMNRTGSPRRLFIEAMAERNGMLILDESHKAGGSGTKATEQKLPRALWFRQIIDSAHSTFYSSATYAKRPDVMDLYRKTDMRLAVDDIDHIAEAIHQGGVPLQQAVAAMLVMAGQYVRRERSFEGVSYGIQTVKVDHAKTESMSVSFKEILDFSTNYAEPAVSGIADTGAAGGTGITGSNAAQAGQISTTGFSSVMHNIIGQSLLALKTQAAVDEAIKAFKKDGTKPVIALANTMGSFIQQYAEDNGLKPGDGMGLQFNDLLFNYLDKTRWYIEKPPYSNVSGIRHYITDAQLGPEGVREYNRIKQFIYDLNLEGIPVSPVDYAMQKLRDAGLRVEEITGRDSRIEYRPDGTQRYRKRPAKDRSIAGKLKIISDFNEDRTDALVINQSGATGLSLHALPKWEGHDPAARKMILLQAEANIDTHMQMLGRVHRAGQVKPPSYIQLMGDIPTEKRPAAVLLGKMASLNANTTASKDSEMSAKDIIDFINKYGDKVVAGIMADFQEMHSSLGEPLSHSDTSESGLTEEGAARKITGRIPILPTVREQDEIYQLIEGGYKDLIQQLDATGQNDLEAKTFNTDARTLQQAIVFEGSNQDSLFTEKAVAKIVDMKKIGKSYSSSEIQTLLKEYIFDFDTRTAKDTDKSLRDIGSEGASKHHEKRADLIDAFNAYKSETIDDIEKEERRRAAEARLNAVGYDWQRIFDRVAPGTVLEIPINGIYFDTVVLNVEQNGKPRNPLALGTWKVTVAVPDSTRRLVVPFSLINRMESFRNRGTVGENALAKFDRASQVARETRTIMTGNLLAAYARYPRGRIINYSDDKGVVHQGVLMPADFNLNAAAEERAVTLNNVDDVVTVLVAGIFIKSTKGDLTITPNQGEFVISVPSSRAGGSRYFLNTGLGAVVGGDFVKSGSRMKRRVPRNNIKNVVEYLINNMREIFQNAADANRVRALLGIEIPTFENVGGSTNAEIQQPETGRPVTQGDRPAGPRYYRITGNGKSVAPDAKAVKLEGYENVKFFTYNTGDEWVIIEMSTGLSAGSGSTQAQAKQKAISNISRVHSTEAGFIEALSKMPQAIDIKETQFSTSEDATPGQGVSLKDIQKQFKGQDVFISPDGSISIRFKNGQGLRILSVQQMSEGNIQYAIESGSMGENGIILGATVGDTITLNKDFADTFTLNHETYHGLSNLGMLTKTDRSVLTNRFNDLKSKGKLEFKPSEHIDPAIRKEENEANTLSQLLRTREQYRNTTTGRIIQKVLDFINGVIYIGRQSATKIAREVETGKIYSRKNKKVVAYKEIQPYIGVSEGGILNGNNVSTEKTYPKVRIQQTGEILTSRRTATTEGDIAEMLAPILNEAAQEEVYLIATAESGKILEIHKFSKGLSGESQIQINQMSGHLLIAPGVNTVFFVHNHPSGNMEYSPGDRKTVKVLSETLKIKGIETKGLIVSNGMYSEFDQHGQEQSKKIKTPKVRNHKFPISERRIFERNHSKGLRLYDSNKATERFVHEEDGIVFTDSQFNEIAFIPFEKGIPIRNAAANILSEAATVNASAAFINMQVVEETNRYKLYNQLAIGLDGQGIRVIDLITKNSNGDLISLLQTGAMYQANPAGIKRLQSDEILFSTSEDALPLSHVRVPKERIYTPAQKDFKKAGGFGQKTKATYKERFAEAKVLAGDKLRQGMVDQFHSLNKVLKDKTAWMMAHLTKSDTGVLMTAINVGMPILDPSGAVDIKEGSKSLKEILKPLGNELDDFLAWIAANRSEKLMAEDKENLFTSEQIAAGKTLNQGREELYDNVRKEFEELGAAITDIAVKTNLVNEEETQQWREEGFYVPFYRMLEEQETSRRGPGNINGLTNQTAYKKLKGGKSQLDDLLTNTLLNWNHLISAGLRNQAGKKALESAEAMGLATRLTSRAFWKEDGDSFKLEGLDATATISLVDGEYLADADGGFVKTFNTLKKAKSEVHKHLVENRFMDIEDVMNIPHGKDSVYIRDNGREIWYELDQTPEGQLVLDSIMSLSYEGLNNPAMKAMRSFKRVLTRGVTASPGFKIRNLIRDSLHAPAVTTASKNPLKNIAVGFKHKRYEERMKAGGGAFSQEGYIHGNDPEASKRLVGVAARTILNTMNRVSLMWHQYENFGNTLENINRVAGFKADLDAGKTLLEANFNARDQLDFSRAGSFSSIRVLTQTIPFLNARLQGLDKISRAVMDPEQRNQFAQVIGMYTIASVALMLAMSGDDDYEEAQEWEKRTYHLFKIPGVKKMFRIPRPFEVGAIAYMNEQMARQFVDVNSDIRELGSALYHTLSDTFAISAVPQAFKPLLEIYANKDSFRNTKIESMSMQYLSKKERSQPWTSEVAKGTSAAMASVLPEGSTLSPVQIQHLVRAYTGWAGATTLASIDFLIKKINGGVTPETKLSEYTWNPVSSFARDEEAKSSKYVNKFYENMSELDKMWGDIRKYRDTPNGKTVTSEQRQKLGYRKMYNKISNQLSNIRKEESRIYTDSNMTSVQKRMRLSVTRNRKNELAKRMVIISKDVF